MSDDQGQYSCRRSPSHVIKRCVTTQVEESYSSHAVAADHQQLPTQLGRNKIIRAPENLPRGRPSARVALVMWL